MTRLVLVLAILSTPFAALAECPGVDQQQAMSCVAGTVWDVEAGACVPVVTG